MLPVELVHVSLRRSGPKRPWQLLLGVFAPPGPVPSAHVCVLPATDGERVYRVRALDRPLNRIDASFLSVTLDMAQVLGTRWWDPDATKIEASAGNHKRDPFDFDRPLLVERARLLGPGYLRLGGSESDRVRYDMRSEIPVASARSARRLKERFSVLSAARLAQVGHFAEAAGLSLVFCLNAGPDPRRRDGSWNPENARTLMQACRAQGLPVSAWELGNEINIFWFNHGPASQLDDDAYAADLFAARRLIDAESPGSRLALGGSAYWPIIGEGFGWLTGIMPGILQRAGAVLDVVNWHYYPQQSVRSPVMTRRAHPLRLLSADTLDEVVRWSRRLVALRDRFAPGKDLWLGETGNAQFGGEPGVSDRYVASLWWMDQCGALAANGHKAVMRQTLAGGDYGLLDEQTLDPRPDWWMSLFWKRIMLPVVLRVRVEARDGERDRGLLRAYAHRSIDGKHISWLFINVDRSHSARLTLPSSAIIQSAWLIDAPDFLGRSIRCNGEALTLATGADPFPSGEKPHAQTDIGPAPECVVGPLGMLFLLTTA